jgi:hypothetical protein
VRLLKTIVLASALAASVLPARAEGADDSFEAQHKRAVAANPADLHLKIALEGDAKSFRIGDTIKVRYELTADVSGKYAAGVRANDRTGRSKLETFVVDRPNDAFDPMRGFWDLWTAIYCLSYSSGAEPHTKLSSSPEQQSFEITHYLRFQTPGKYRLYAATRGVVLLDAPKTKPPDKSGLRHGIDDASLFSRMADAGGAPLASENVLEFELLPRDESGAANEVATILAKATQETAPRFQPVDAFRLFEIGTPAAREAAAEIYIGHDASANDVAISVMIADPVPGAAVELLERRLRTPSLPVSEDLIMDLALLQLRRQNPSLTADSILNGGGENGERSRDALIGYLSADLQMAVGTLSGRPAPVRASSVRALYHLSGYHVCSKIFPFTVEQNKMLATQHLETLPDLPQHEQTYELMNFGWAKEFPHEKLLPILSRIYENPPRQNAQFSRETVLQIIQRLDPKIADGLLRHNVLLADDAKFDIYRVQHLNLTPGPDLDLDVITMLDSGRTNEMTRAAPIIALYATPSLLARVRKAYESKADWPCAIEGGLLTYFLRVDSEYGVAKAGLALEASYKKLGTLERNSPGTCYQGTMLVDMALLRNPPELKPFVSSALDDLRPLVAAGGARASAIGDVAFIPTEPLIARLRNLHDGWHNDVANSDDAKKDGGDDAPRWSSGYDELERMIVWALVNMNDTQEHAAAWKKAYDLCVSDGCRKSLRQRMDRSRY